MQRFVYAPGCGIRDRHVEDHEPAFRIKDPELVAGGVNLSVLSLSTLRHVDESFGFELKAEGLISSRSKPKGSRPKG